MMPTDIEIAQSIIPQPLKTIASKLAIDDEDVEYYGKTKAKIPLKYINKQPKGKLILVTAMSPTKYGEGKTTMSIGLHDALCRLGYKSVAALREPSLGPVFGIKGGAAGGGYAQVIPMEDINLHFTGDFAAIEKANNLLSAIIDNHLHNKPTELNINPRTIAWNRVMDMNDRSLRDIIIGLGGQNGGVPRQEKFNITPASEIMAILCLAKDFSDLKNRLGKIFVGNTYSGNPIYASDLKCVGAMATLLKDAIKPNLVQTLEGNPVLLHGGPFASIAQGTNSVLATKMALSLGDYVVTEAGFGADLGAEKFFHIKCAQSGLVPSAVVIVATIRALKHHGSVQKNDLAVKNIDAIKVGFNNLKRHINNIKLFGITPIVTINAFPQDHEEEWETLISLCKDMGIKSQVNSAFSKGSIGAVELAEEVVSSIKRENGTFTPIYSNEDSIESKIHQIATKIYGADGVSYTPKAKNQLKGLKNIDMAYTPVCIAKTPLSFSDNEKLLGAPTQFTITVREIEISRGAGFVVPLLGDVMRMPGLPSVPNAENIDIDDDGVISGLF